MRRTSPGDEFGRLGDRANAHIARVSFLCHDARAVPTYDYQCRACGTVTEVIHSMREDGPSVCELCGGALRRVLFPTGIIFKGSGFYRNDSRASGASSSSESDKGDESDKRGESEKGGESDKRGGSDKNGGSGLEKKSGSTAPEKGSSESKAASNEARST